MILGAGRALKESSHRLAWVLYLFVFNRTPLYSISSTVDRSSHGWFTPAPACINKLKLV